MFLLYSFQLRLFRMLSKGSTAKAEAEYWLTENEKERFESIHDTRRYLQHM